MKKNIIPMILPHLQRAALFIATGCLFLLAACTDPNDDFIPGTQNDQSKVTIVVTVPGAQLPTTRGMADEKGEATVEEIDILVFDCVNSPETLVQHVSVIKEPDKDNIQQSTDKDEKYKVTFKAALDSRTGKSRLVIVANAREQVAAMLVATKKEKGGPTKKEVMENLLYATTGSGEGRKWKAEGIKSKEDQGNYTPIPMYAEKEMEKIQSGTQIDAIALQRMLARIDVLNNATGEFTLEKIHLVNYNLAGYIAPAWDEDNGNLLATAPEDPYIPGSANPQTGAANALAYTYTDSGTGYEGEIYTYESVAAKDDTSNDLGRKNATCLVLEGKMVGDDVTPHFYRVDFTQYQETIDDPDEIPYIPLRRNHKYKVDVLAVEGVGYGSLVDALNSYTVVSNLKTRIIAYDQGKIKDVVYDGQYMLGVEEGEYELAREINKVKVNIFTDSPNGWKATIPAHDDSWLTFDGNRVTSVTGACGDSNASLTFWTTTFKGIGNRTAKIVVTAGRLTKEIIVTQTDENRLWIRITDEDGNPITKVEYIHFQGVTKLKPTKIFVSWGGSDELQINGSTESGSYFQYDERYDRISGAYTGNHKIFTIMTEEGFELPSSLGNSYFMDTKLRFRLKEPFSGEWDYTDATLDLTCYFVRGLVHFPFVGAFWRWNQSGERLIRMNVPAGEWKAEVTKGTDFIRLDTENTIDPNVWYEDRTPADMNLDSNDLKHRLSDKAKTKIGGTAQAMLIENTSNLYFRIGLTGPYRSDAGLTGSGTPRYGEVLVTYPGGTQTIYIRQGEAAAELIEGSGVYWSPYNMSDPQRGAGGNNINDHKEVQTGEGDFIPEKFTDYPSQGGYFFQWNRVRAYHPVIPYSNTASVGTISGWLLNHENSWESIRDVCPKGYRHLKGKMDDPTSEYYIGLFENAPGTDNSMWGYYADGFFDRIYLKRTPRAGEKRTRGGDGSEVSYVGRLFFNTGTSASLFFPAGGYRHRTYDDDFEGSLSEEGTQAVYFFADKNTDGDNNGVAVAYFSETLVPIYSFGKRIGTSIRCVKGEKQ